MSQQASAAASTHAAPESSSNEHTANELTVLREQVKRLQGMATLGELTGTATHEFNNVLMTVINYAKLGLRNEDKASRDKALTKILEASERAAQITNTILAQARNRSDTMGPVDLSGLVRETLVLMQREMQKYRISVETDLADTATVHASGNQIQRLLLNLLTNSRQAIGECGTLWIRVATCESGTDGPGHVELTVRDSGKGIPEDVLPKIFDPYFSTKAGPDETGKGGTGLGLAACKDIIDEHKGRVRVESSVGRGTAFIIRLPISPSQRAAA